MRQKTVRGEVRLRGIGIHTGESVSVSVKPLPPNSGIVFKKGENFFPASVDMVFSTHRATALGENGVKTTEHLLSALYGLGIDNALVEVEGPEVPIMDGSALPFVNAILRVGVKEQDAEKRAFYVKDRFEFSLSDGRSFVVEPSDRLEVIYSISYPPPIGKGVFRFTFSFKSYYYSVAPARTFGFISDYWKLKKSGLAKGSGLGNTVVFSSSRAINPPLRFRDEYLRHKVLDLLGDLALMGCMLVGRIRVSMGGHTLHCTALRELVKAKLFEEYPLNGSVEPFYPKSIVFFSP